MGGDFAPQSAVEGALYSIQERDDLIISLIGKKEKIETELFRHTFNANRIQIFDADEIVTMADSATKIMKTKPDSSLIKGIQLHKEGMIDGFVSMGNTGAVLTSALLILGRIQNVKRPTIGAFLPNTKTGCLLLDVGASLEVRAEHLFQFALMGQIFYSHMLGVKNPTVGLLNVGEEKTKGTSLLVETYELLSKLSNFKGNIEGRDILHGTTDIIVCDGYVGNVILKFAGSIYPFIKSKAKQHIGKNFPSILGMKLIQKPLQNFEKEMDYQEYGGVPLLGVNGTVVIGHGKSTPRAFMNAILNARKMVHENINKIIRDNIADHFNSEYPA